MYWKALDKIDSSLYKGIAILMIVTHNFMHLFPKPKENEFNFYSDRFFDFLHIAYFEPGNIVRVSLSFFGHFGVQIFVFLSAYGLTKKYLLRKPNYWIFIWQRVLKIYPAFLLAILAWCIISGWVLGERSLLGPAKVLYWSITPLLLKLSLLSNFVPNFAFSPVGPWWFIPFIFQFYFTFPLLRYLHSCCGDWVLLSISVIGILFSMLNHGKIGELNIYLTVLGHLPELCLGIYLATKDSTKIKISKLILLLAFIMFILGNVYEIFWYVNHISFLMLLLAGFGVLVRSIKNTRNIRKMFLFFGSISMPLFLVNGFLRQPFISWAKYYDHWLLTIVLCLISLAISILVSFVLTKIEVHMMSKVEGTTPIALYNEIKSILMSKDRS